MKKSAEIKYNPHVLELASKHQKKLQREVGTNWWYGGSKTSRLLGILSEIGFYFTLLVNSIIMLSYGMLLSMNASTENWAMERAMLKNALSSFVAGTIIVAVGYILKKISRSKMKRGSYNQSTFLLVSMIFFIVGCILLFITAYNVLVTANIDNMYAEAVEASTPFKIYVELICLHVLPLLMMLVPSVLFYIMSRCDWGEKKEIYERMTETLYKNFVKENPTYNSEQWEEYLNSYEGFDSPCQNSENNEE